MTDPRQTFTELETAATAALRETGFAGPDLALDAARANAQDTMAEGGGFAFESPEFFRVALASISFTAAFDESAEVREWFAARGYRW